LFGYHFPSRSEVVDETITLTAGFLTALISFSDSLSTSDNLLKIRSQQLFYILVKQQDKIYALQSQLYQNNLESQFFETIRDLTPLLADVSARPPSTLAQLPLDAMTKVLDHNFATFVRA